MIITTLLGLAYSQYPDPCTRVIISRSNVTCTFICEQGTQECKIYMDFLCDGTYKEGQEEAVNDMMQRLMRNLMVMVMGVVMLVA